MQESQVLPVGVFIGREAKAVKNEQTGLWERPDPQLRTKDFRDAEGNLIKTAVDQGGREWEGKAVVDGYFLLK